MSAERDRGPGSEYARELAELRDVLAGPSVGARSAGQLAQLRRLVEMYPDQAAQYVAEVQAALRRTSGQSG